MDKALLRDIEVADLLRVSVSALRNARSTGQGPLAKLRYIRIGRSIRYRAADIDAFVRALARQKGGAR